MNEYEKMLEVKLVLLIGHGYKNITYDILYDDPDLYNIVKNQQERNAYNNLADAIVKKLDIEDEIEFWTEKLA